MIHAFSNGIVKVWIPMLLHITTHHEGHHWIKRIEYLRGNTQDECAQLFSEYKKCLMVCCQRIFALFTLTDVVESSEGQRHRHYAGWGTKKQQGKWFWTSEKVIAYFFLASSLSGGIESVKCFYLHSRLFVEAALYWNRVKRPRQNTLLLIGWGRGGNWSNTHSTQ